MAMLERVKVRTRRAMRTSIETTEEVSNAVLESEKVRNGRIRMKRKEEGKKLLELEKKLEIRQKELVEDICYSRFSRLEREKLYSREEPVEKVIQNVERIHIEWQIDAQDVGDMDIINSPYFYLCDEQWFIRIQREIEENSENFIHKITLNKITTDYENGIVCMFSLRHGDIVIKKLKDKFYYFWKKKKSVLLMTVETSKHMSKLYTFECRIIVPHIVCQSDISLLREETRTLPFVRGVLMIDDFINEVRYIEAKASSSKNSDDLTNQQQNRSEGIESILSSIPNISDLEDPAFSENSEDIPSSSSNNDFLPIHCIETRSPQASRLQCAQLIQSSPENDSSINQANVMPEESTSSFYIKSENNIEGFDSKEGTDKNEKDLDDKLDEDSDTSSGRVLIIDDLLNKVQYIQAEKSSCKNCGTHGINNSEVMPEKSTPKSENDVEEPDSKETPHKNIKDQHLAEKFDENSDASSGSVGNLITNLRNMFISGCLCDVVIKVGNKTFQAHKTILAAQSSVFKAMFQNTDMVENVEGIIEIVDCDEETFRDFLLFLYTEYCDNLVPSNAISLYKTAEKYDVQQLKLLCCSCLKQNVPVCLALDALLLAQVYDECEILEIATKVFVSNAAEILPTEKWKAFLEENFSLANELLMKMAKICQENAKTTK